MHAKAPTQYPGAPIRLRATLVSIEVMPAGNEVRLGWHAPKHGARVVGYEVLRDGSRIGSTRKRRFSDRALAAGRTYRYEVRAWSKGRHLGPASRAIKLRVPGVDHTPPSVPTGLSARALSDTQIALGWRGSSDDVGVAAYDVYRDGTFVTSVLGRSFPDAGLAAGTPYTYEVAARDSAGNRSARSRPASATTAVGPNLPALMNQAMVDRLFWRAGFGPSAADRAQWIGQPVTALVDHFLGTAQSYPPTSTPPTNQGQPIDPLASNDDLVMEWLYRMQTGVNPFTERLTFFWHRHFAVNRANGTPAAWLVTYRNRLQRYGDLAGNPNASFRQLALEMTTQDGAMSFFLTGNLNIKGHPNENYAREFMELFCLGVFDAAGNANYTQTDVQELARAFTGWTLNQKPADPNYGQVTFSPSEFDAGSKTILGQTGAFTAAQAVDIVLGHHAHAPFLLTKLWHEFILAPIPPVTLADLVATYTAGGQLLLAPILRKILSHPLIFESIDEPIMIKPPVVYYVGLLKAMDAPMRDYWPVQELRGMQQVPYDPPNVSGWEGGLSWLNTSTVATRYDAIISSQYLKYKGSAIDEGGPGETAQQAYDRAYAAVGSPWLASATAQLVLGLAGQFPGATQSQRRSRQYALRALFLAGPDGQVM